MLSTASLLLAAIGGVLDASPTWAAGRGAVEVPAQVVTDGLTVDQQLQRQSELAASLLRELPQASSLKQVSVLISPAEMAAVDQVDRSTSPLKIGFVKSMAPAVNLSGFGRGTVPSKGDGLVWALAVKAELAGAIRLHVEDLNLPDGAELYVYSRAGEAYGPYTGRGPDGTGEFWTTSLFGTEAIVQLRVAGTHAAASLNGAAFRITEIGIISPTFTGPEIDAAAASFCGNVSCIVDASCYSGANSIKDAYAKMEWIAGPYIYTCTGGLLNDSNPSSTNYFLTANHCLSRTNTAKNVSFYWRFRTSSCNGACPSNNGWPYKTTGSAVASTSRNGDYTLLSLNAAPPAGSVKLGFTSAPVANTNGVALHRVSNPDFGPQVYNEQSVSTSAPTCTGWPRGERIYSKLTLGATDGGSSGSPVVNSSDQVVGQLSGGCGTNVGNPCDTVNNATVDGAFAYYWSSVQPILAP
jgi:hypothetical protein